MGSYAASGVVATVTSSLVVAGASAIGSATASARDQGSCVGVGMDSISFSGTGTGLGAVGALGFITFLTADFLGGFVAFSDFSPVYFGR